MGGPGRDCTIDRKVCNLARHETCEVGSFVWVIPVIPNVPGSKLPILGMGIIQPLVGNPYNGAL